MTTHELKIPYDDVMLASLGKTREEIEQRMRFVMAAKLFELGELSSGQASKLCGMARMSFLLKLGEIGVPVIDLSDEELAYELREAELVHSR